MRMSDWSSDVCSSDLTPVFGRFALAVGSPYAPDGVPAPRSLALDLTARDGSTWRTAMNSVPLFPVGNVRDFVALQRATTPDPATGKPDPAVVDAFMAAHPETRAFGAMLSTRPLSSSFPNGRTEEHTYETQAIHHTTYAVSCLKKNKSPT